MRESSVDKVKDSSSANMIREINSHLNLAINGYYPLLAIDWSSSKELILPMRYRCAKKNLQTIFHKISKYKSLGQKRTAVLKLTQSEKAIFLSSLLKAAEYDILKSIQVLH